VIVIRIPNIKAMKEIRSRKGHLVRFAQIRKAFTILIGKPEKKETTVFGEGRRVGVSGMIMFRRIVTKEIMWV
jgi:hypothetical protein